MSIVNVTNENEFSQTVLDAEMPVLVDFWAPWCGPCRMIAPELEAVAKDYDGKAIVAKVNVDDHQQIASKYNVMGIPTLLVFKDGQEVNRIVGFRPRKELGEILDTVK